MKDTVRLQEQLARKATECLREAGAELYFLPPTATEARIGVSGPVTASEVRDRLHSLSGEGVAIVEKEIQTNLNLYEFNQEDVVPPGAASLFYLTPRPHCNIGGTFLKSRKVSIELLADEGDVAIVPRSGLGPRVLTRDRLAESRLEGVTNWGAAPRPPFPIDLVYTWVDSDDPHWKRLHGQYREAGEVDQAREPTSASNAARWHSRDELLYSLRSVEMYAPFVRRIYIVTNGQRPKWLVNHKRIRVVAHDEIFPNTAALPTFNSHAIEACLHLIPGLSEHFIYLNDDFFFGSPVSWKSFFTPGGIGKIFPSPRHLDTRSYVSGDRATVAAHKKSRDLLYDTLGVRCEYKFKHAPYVLRRTTLELMERAFPNEIEETRHHRFRSIDDITPISYMYNHFALVRGHSVSSSIKYGYVDVGAPDFINRLHALERARPKVFCINDADSSDEDVDRNTGDFVAYLEARFPVPAPWEGRPRGGSAVFESRVNATDKSSLYVEMERLGPEVAIREYRRLADPSRYAIISKLMRALYLTGDFAELRRTADELAGGDRRLRLLRLTLLTKTTMPTREAVDYANFEDEAAIAKSLPWLGRTISGRSDFDDYQAYLEQAPFIWEDSSHSIAWVANAARRGQRLDTAIDLFERALLNVDVGVESAPRAKAFKPWSVLDDFYEVAGPHGEAIFPDAGTLLGFIRDGDFIGHDYDIDFGVRDTDVYGEIRERLYRDWRFDVARGRTPELLTQARHHSGVDVDLLLHRWRAGSWEKRSHVYGWRFRDYTLDPLVVQDRYLRVPTPAPEYLTQMYGENWEQPQQDFDSRIEAPNCFFPDPEELVCTVLNKLITAYRAGDLDLVEKLSKFIEQQTRYSPPVPQSIVET